MMRRLSLAAAGLATLTMLTSCDLLSHGCTQKGGYSGVVFEDIAEILPVPARMATPEQAASSPGPTAQDGRTYLAVGCADGVCEEMQGTRADLPAWLHVVLDHVTAPTTVTATLTVTEVETSEVVFDASTPVDLMMWLPNGPGCPPTVFLGRLQPTRGGALVWPPDPQ